MSRSAWPGVTPISSWSDAEAGVSTIRPQPVPTITSAAPAILAPVTGSPANATPMIPAHSGSVPRSRLTRAGLVALNARNWTRKANTVQANARYAIRDHWAGPKAAAMAETDCPDIVHSTNATTATASSCTKVVRAGSIPRPADSRAMTVTCTARNRAAITMRVSPIRGSARPPD
jgi:hypothetical protein